MFQIGKILVQGLISSFGTAAIAANAVAGNIASLEIIPGSAIGMAVITVVGQCIGARDYDGVKKYVKRLMAITYLSMAILNIPLLFLIPQLVGFYNLSGEAMQIAYEILLLHGICAIVIWPASFSLPNALRAANDVKFTMIIAIASMWIFRIGFSYLLALNLNMGVMGVWIAMIIDWCVRAVFLIWRYMSGKWKTKRYI